MEKIFNKGQDMEFGAYIIFRPEFYLKGVGNK